MDIRGPKEPRSFKYPRMYARFDPSCRWFCRLIIINPDGSSEWFEGALGESMGIPCWHREDNHILGGKLSVARMKRSVEGGLTAPVFIGEIKMRGER